MPRWEKCSFLFMNLRLRLNYSSLHSFVGVVGVCSLLSLVLYSLPRKMATSDYDVIAGAVCEEEYALETAFLIATSLCFQVMNDMQYACPCHTSHHPFVLSV